MNKMEQGRINLPKGQMLFSMQAKVGPSNKNPDNCHVGSLSHINVGQVANMNMKRSKNLYQFSNNERREFNQDVGQQ